MNPDGQNSQIDASLAHRWARQVKASKKIEDLDLFGPISAVAGGGVSNAGRPRLPTRLMVALLYLKLAFNGSDEGVIKRWGETPTWPYFSGNEYFEHQWHATPHNWGASFTKALIFAVTATFKSASEKLAASRFTSGQLRLIKQCAYRRAQRK